MGTRIKKNMGNTEQKTKQKIKLKMKLIAPLFAAGALSHHVAINSSICDNCNVEKCYYAIDGHPSEFVECCNGKDMIMECAEGLYWNDSVKECQFWVPDPHPVPVDPDYKDICASCPWDKQCYYSIKDDATSFIQCSNGKSVTHHCPSGLVWNGQLNVCDWPSHPEFCDNKCKQWDTCYYASPDSQQQYYKCPEGLQNCPLDKDGQQTYWDEDVNACICQNCS